MCKGEDVADTRFIDGMVKRIALIRRGENPASTFRDFLAAAAYAIHNRCSFSEEYEAAYMEIARRYGADMGDMTRLLGDIATEIATTKEDVLGSLYMAMESGNKWMAQFFTPYHVSLLMAQMIMGDCGDVIKRNGFVTMLEPACGAGGMVLAAAQAVRDAGYDPAEVLMFHAVDIDQVCAHMAFIQASAIGLPGIVAVGDSLSNRSYRAVYVTPAYAMGGWARKLGDRDRKTASAGRSIARGTAGGRCVK